MAKNITLRLDDQVLRKARHQAVERNQSLSQWLTELIVRSVERSDRFVAARRRAAKRLSSPWHLGGKALTREQAHER